MIGPREGAQAGKEGRAMERIWKWAIPMLLVAEIALAASGATGATGRRGWTWRRRWRTG